MNTGMDYNLKSRGKKPLTLLLYYCNPKNLKNPTVINLNIFVRDVCSSLGMCVAH